MDSREKLNSLKTEVASELGIQFKAYNGDMPSSKAGSVGGAMVRKMVDSYKGSVK